MSDRNSRREIIEGFPFDTVLLALPVGTVIVGCDSIAQLEENVEIARSFTPMRDAQLAQLERRADPVHEQALFVRRWDS